jgi:hypothetical protein
VDIAEEAGAPIRGIKPKFEGNIVQVGRTGEVIGSWSPKRADAQRQAPVSRPSPSGRCQRTGAPIRGITSTFEGSIVQVGRTARRRPGRRRIIDVVEALLDKLAPDDTRAA